MTQNETRSNPGLTISVLNPTATFSDDINQNAIVLKMTYESVSFMFMGDANTDAETRIANSGTNLQADILKVGHHGSAKSSSSSFISKVQPKISVIEVGAGNPYGHPTSATYGRLAQVGSAVYRTDLDGDVTVTTDGTTGRCQYRTDVTIILHASFDIILCAYSRPAMIFGGDYPWQNRSKLALCSKEKMQ